MAELLNFLLYPPCI